MRGVILDDLQPLMSFSGLLEMSRRRYTLLGEDTATLADLRQGPTIFLGAFDNTWTLRMTRDLRYRFGNDPDMSHFWIEDTQSHNQLRWSVDREIQQTTHNYRDYAIVARFRDANTGKLAIVAAGIARGEPLPLASFSPSQERWMRSKPEPPAIGTARTWRSCSALRLSMAAPLRQKLWPRTSGDVVKPGYSGKAIWPVMWKWPVTSGASVSGWPPPMLMVYSPPAMMG